MILGISTGVLLSERLADIDDDDRDRGRDRDRDRDRDDGVDRDSRDDSNGNII